MDPAGIFPSSKCCVHQSFARYVGAGAGVGAAVGLPVGAVVIRLTIENTFTG